MCLLTGQLVTSFMCLHLPFAYNLLTRSATCPSEPSIAASGWLGPEGIAGA